MGLFSFIKEAGEKLFGSDEPAEVAAKIQKHIEKQNLGLTDLKVTFDGEHKIVKLEGFAPSQAASEKAGLTAGNVSGVAGVYNYLKLPEQVAAEAAQAQAAESRFHDVEKGDTLSAIAKKYYGDANQYNKIFEANKPMLTHPDKIYPGQKLRIPD